MLSFALVGLHHQADADQFPPHASGASKFSLLPVLRAFTARSGAARMTNQLRMFGSATTRCRIRSDFSTGVVRYPAKELPRYPHLGATAEIESES